MATTPPSTTETLVDDRPPPMAVRPIPGGVLNLEHSIPIADVVWRQRAQVSGHIRSIRVRTWAEVATLEVVLSDATGGLTLAFLGRRRLGGIKPGASLTVEGMVGARDGKLLIINPAYDLREIALPT